MIWLYVFQEWLSLTGHCRVPNRCSCVLRVNDEVGPSRAINTFILPVQSYIMICKHDKCALSAASLARISKHKVTLLSSVSDQDVFVHSGRISNDLVSLCCMQLYHNPICYIIY